ncbi:hypothetical protein GSI_05851 [Ganoderma sinense ZZ0214-1]|uniref:Uncharacterized protein n=1 Tax=Ganoderma sinense ZZ0214-1 TaxID=1077348 RepID=A0A2G8SBL3_9APHY|nr:hypothetical protein GSI_05851 [Ganoderma sinense ZZ0214-1]
MQPPRSPRLPWEVIERIIGHSGDNPDSLCSFSLTCRELLPRSRCLMMAAGVKLRSRDHAFELVDFLQDNPHLKPFITSITADPSDLPAFPLLRILSYLSKIAFIAPMATSQKATVSLHRSHLASFRLFGSHIQTLHLLNIYFATRLEFAHLLLAFSRITHLVCEGVYITTGDTGNQAPVAIAERRLSEKLRLRSLISDSWSLAGNTVGDVLLDPNFKLALSTLESLHVTRIYHSDLSARLRLSEFSMLQALVLHFPPDHGEKANTVKLLADTNTAMCKDVTIQFNEELGFAEMTRYLADSRDDSELENTLLKFSRVTIIRATQPLRANAHLFFPAGHHGDILAFTASPNSEWIVSGSSDSTIILWNTKDGSIAQQLVFPGYLAVHSLAFSLDAHYLACGGQGGKAVVWDLWESVPLMVATLEGHSSFHAVTGCAWAPDGTIIATASSDAPVRLWDASTFQVLHVLREGDVGFHPTVHPHVTFSPDGRWLPSACTSSRYCCVWDILLGTLHKVIPRGEGSVAVYTLMPVFDLGSTRLLITLGNHKVEIWDIEMDERLFVSPQGLPINAASFSTDGKLVLAAAAEEAVNVWDVDTGVKLLEFKGHGPEKETPGQGTNTVRAAQFSPCGKYIASGGDDFRGLLWRTGDGTCVGEFSVHEDMVTHVAFSPDGKTLASAALDGTVVIRRMSDIIPIEEGS